MTEFNIILPSKPVVVSEDDFSGVYEIEGLYPGYGHTLGNSLRRIILSSLPGFSITSLKVDGANHEFSTLEGVKEDVISIILNLKKVRFKVTGDEPQTVNLTVKGEKVVTAGDINCPGQIEVANPDQHIATITDKKGSLDIEIHLEKGLGYVPKDILQKEKMEIGVIAVDASFTPIRRASYEVENMRVGNRTDYNKLRIAIETDGTISPKEALESSISTMITQLKAVVGFKEEPKSEETYDSPSSAEMSAEEESAGSTEEDVLKTRVEDLSLSTRTQRALATASIRTIGGLTRKTEDDLLALDGLGEKGVQEIKRALSNYGITLK